MSLIVGKDGILNNQSPSSPLYSTCGQSGVNSEEDVALPSIHSILQILGAEQISIPQ